MAEIAPPSAGPDQEVERGAALGHVLYHALIGRCFATHSMPEEGYFLDYIMQHMGSDNFTVRGECFTTRMTAWTGIMCL